MSQNSEREEMNAAIADMYRALRALRLEVAQSIVDDISLRFRRVELAAKASAGAVGWLPISSAPKDGSEFIGLFDGNSVSRMKWWNFGGNHKGGWFLGYQEYAPTLWTPFPPRNNDENGDG